MARKTQKKTTKKKNTSKSARKSKPVVSPDAISQALLDHVTDIAEKCRAAAIFVYADALVEQTLPLPKALKKKAYYITRNAQQDQDQKDAAKKYIRVPDVRLSRIGQVKIAIFMALSQGIIRQGDTVVCLTGIARSGNIDTVIVSQLGREYEIFSTTDTIDQTPSQIRADVLEKVINLASQLGSEGREGKPVGAIFVLGDTDRVIPLTKQLVLNPFQGYPENERNILDESFEETIKEFSTIDGAFIIRGDGVVETCGSYLKTASQKEFELPRGLGARHHAAAAITAVTDAIAVVVSESTGTVTIFRAGKILTEIEKPRRIGAAADPAAQNPETPIE